METKFAQMGSDKDHIVNQIINREWKMFQDVENLGGRATCQDDVDTFYIMRYSQHSVLGKRVLEAYREDLLKGDRQGRNLIMEKYAYMMESTDPAYFLANLYGKIPYTTQEKINVIDQIQEIMAGFRQEFRNRFPRLASKGRPDGTSFAETSIDVYLVGELKTYGLQTLMLYLEDLKEQQAQGINTVLEIQTHTVRFYGYANLEAAEAKA